MQYPEYAALFDAILNRPAPQPPYTDAAYLDYTRLNHSRMNRWWKTLQLDERLVAALRQLEAPQTWIIIAEPWCGDAAPSVPFLVRLAEQNPRIRYDIQLRDAEPFLINSYRTNGGKSIPKLIVRDAAGQDLFTWGPRPAGAQQLVDELNAAKADFETLKTQLQGWYNADKGRSLQDELLALITRTPVG